MKVSISWLKELVDLNCSISELIELLPLRSISVKEATNTYIELDMKGYNRADLLSMRGVAQEVAAITGSKPSFEEPQEADFAWNQQKLPDIEVISCQANSASVYCVAKIEGLKVGKSDQAVVKKLAESGMRSVDNITDVTNLIMQEYGQPLHAFDARAAEAIGVEKAWPAKFITLDGKERWLIEDDIIIKNRKEIIGIGGIMGGKNSEVTTSTTSIVLEAAIFDPIQIRKTSTRLGLQSEASKRFQHGLTTKRLLQALNAAIKMYQNLGGKLTAISFIDLRKLEGIPLNATLEQMRETILLPDPIKRIKLTKKKLEELVGIKFEGQEVEKYLERLGFTLALQGETLRAWEVGVPYFRLDVNLEEDVIEEVARMYGYEKIPATKVSESQPLQKEGPIFQQIQDLRKKLVSLGLTEVQTYSFYSTNVLNALDQDREKLIKVANPISAETEYLRDQVWPNLVEVIGKNLRKGFKDITVFEIGKVFEVGADENPVESYRLSIALLNGSDNPLSELHQVAEKIINSRGAKLIHLRGVQNYFHPKRVMEIEKDEKEVGNLAEVHLRVLNKLGIEKRVAILEVSLEKAA